MTKKDRCKIEALLNAGSRPCEIARIIGCSKRTIERERRRGSVEQ
ncbi:MAG: helix-turn-helix domain-containing protein [Anaerovoracaceae bacterium]